MIYEDDIRQLAREVETAAVALEWFNDAANRPAIFDGERRLKWAEDRAIAHTHWMIAFSKLEQLKNYISKPAPLAVP